MTGAARNRLLKSAFWAAAVFAFVMAVLPHPPRLPGSPSDKIQHITAFATLGLLSGLAYPRTAIIRLIVLLSLFGAVIEIVQAIPALNRDSDAIDWIADTIACALVVAALGWWRMR
ncbi:MAG: hypothetical protein ABIR63_08770, partial [Sphingomicrobium sp.]